MNISEEHAIWKKYCSYPFGEYLYKLREIYLYLFNKQTGRFRYWSSRELFLGYKLKNYKNLKEYRKSLLKSNFKLNKSYIKNCYGIRIAWWSWSGLRLSFLWGEYSKTFIYNFDNNIKITGKKYCWE